jgi:hypothetical protein
MELSYIQPLESEQNGLRLNKSYTRVKYRYFIGDIVKFIFEKRRLKMLVLPRIHTRRPPTETEMCGNRAC